MQLGKEKFIAAVRKFMQMDRLTAPLLQELIDRIDVYEVTGTGKNRKQQIKIHYKFVWYLELPSLARQHNYREENRKGVAVEYVPNALPAYQKEQDNPCSYIQEDAKCRQKEIECPYPNSQVGYEHSIWQVAPI